MLDLSCGIAKFPLKYLSCRPEEEKNVYVNIGIFKNLNV